jgi:hypothetical protein
MKTSSMRISSDRDSNAAAQPSGQRSQWGNTAAAEPSRQSAGDAFVGADKDSGWGDAVIDEGNGWGDLDLLEDDFDRGSVGDDKRDTNCGGSSAFGTPVTTFSGASRGGSTDTASLDVKVSEGTALYLFVSVVEPALSICLSASLGVLALNWD